MLAESVVPRPLCTYPEISGMITFPDQHLAAKEAKVKTDPPLKISKTVPFGDIELPLIELAGRESHWHHLQTEAESLISDDLSEAFNFFNSISMQNWTERTNAIKTDDDIGKLLLLLSGMLHKHTDFNIHDTLTPLLLRAIKHHERKLAILLVRSPKVTTILNKTFERKSLLAWAIDSCKIEPVYWGDNMTTFGKDVGEAISPVDVVEELLEFSIRRLTPAKSDGTADIIRAVNTKNLKVVNLLCFNCDPEARDESNNSLLHLAAYTGSVDIVSRIFTLNPDLIRTVNSNDDSPLHIAARDQHFEVLQFLMNEDVCMCMPEEIHDCDLSCREKLKNARGQTILALSNPSDASEVTNPIHALALLSSLNAQVKSRDGGRTKSTIVCADLSKGREALPIRVVNEADNCSIGNWIYASRSRPWRDRQLDSSIESMQTCTCTDGCTSEKGCLCNQMSENRWYSSDGRLRGRVDLANQEATAIPVIYECSDLCSCNPKDCKNRVTGKGIQFLMEVFRTKGMGWGIRAREAIPKGSFIAEYCGEIISNSEADKREDTYLFDLSILAGREYSFCVDANRIGNFARFFNHICEPNMIPIRVFRHHQDFRFPQLAFFARRDIRAGEEIGFDYGERFWEVKNNYFSCKCGSKLCRYTTIKQDKT